MNVVYATRYFKHTGRIRFGLKRKHKKKKKTKKKKSECLIGVGRQKCLEITVEISLKHNLKHCVLTDTMWTLVVETALFKNANY